MRAVYSRTSRNCSDATLRGRRCPCSHRSPWPWSHRHARWQAQHGQASQIACVATALTGSHVTPVAFGRTEAAQPARAAQPRMLRRLRPAGMVDAMRVPAVLIQPRTALAVSGVAASEASPGVEGRCAAGCVLGHALRAWQHRGLCLLRSHADLAIFPPTRTPATVRAFQRRRSLRLHTACFHA